MSGSHRYGIINPIALRPHRLLAMATCNSLEDVGASLFLTDGKPPYAHLRESTTTYRRPLGQNEVGYAIIRGPCGYFDSFSIVPFTCSGGHTITDDEVTQACAALRLRHPLLASKVAYSTESLPEFVVHSPMTEAHALREARAQIEFRTFHDHEAATEALRNRWFSATPEDALDLRNGTCSLYWGRDIDPRSGRYILGFMTTHFVTDGRRRLNLVRCMLELLAAPGRAKEELAAYFAGQTPIVDLPPPWEALFPEMGALNVSEMGKAKAAFDELIKYRSKVSTTEAPLTHAWTDQTFSPSRGLFPMEPLLKATLQIGSFARPGRQRTPRASSGPAKPAGSRSPTSPTSPARSHACSALGQEARRVGRATRTCITSNSPRHSM